MERVERMKDEAKQNKLSSGHRRSSPEETSAPSFIPIESSSSIESIPMSIHIPVPLTLISTQSNTFSGIEEEKAAISGSSSSILISGSLLHATPHGCDRSDRPHSLCRHGIVNGECEVCGLSQELVLMPDRMQLQGGSALTSDSSELIAKKAKYMEEIIVDGDRNLDYSISNNEIIGVASTGGWSSSSSTSSSEDVITTEEGRGVEVHHVLSEEETLRYELLKSLKSWKRKIVDAPIITEDDVPMSNNIVEVAFKDFEEESNMEREREIRLEKGSSYSQPISDASLSPALVETGKMTIETVDWNNKEDRMEEEEDEEVDDIVNTRKVALILHSYILELWLKTMVPQQLDGFYNSYEVLLREQLQLIIRSYSSIFEFCEVFPDLFRISKQSGISRTKQFGILGTIIAIENIDRNYSYNNHDGSRNDDEEIQNSIGDEYEGEYMFMMFAI